MMRSLAEIRAEEKYFKEVRRVHQITDYENQKCTDEECAWLNDILTPDSVEKIMHPEFVCRNIF